MLDVGQKWYYKCDDAFDKPYLIVRMMERYKDVEVVHISVKDINVRGELWDIDHLPMERNILIASLESEIEPGHDLAGEQEFDEAYSLWKGNNGGVWSTELKFTVRCTLENAGILSSES
jgi:hypothetical protein